MSFQINKNKRHDESKQFLDQFVELFEDALSHDGYADFHVEFRNTGKKQKEIIFNAGKQYRYKIDVTQYMETNAKKSRRYRVVKCKPLHHTKNRRHQDRRTNLSPRNFKLERRCGKDRRQFSEE